MRKFQRTELVGVDGLTDGQRESKRRAEIDKLSRECTRLRNELGIVRLRLKQRPMRTQPCSCRCVVREAIRAFHPDRNRSVCYSAHEVTQKLLDTLRTVEGFVPLAHVCDVDGRS